MLINIVRVWTFGKQLWNMETLKGFGQAWRCDFWGHFGRPPSWSGFSVSETEQKPHKTFIKQIYRSNIHITYTHIHIYIHISDIWHICCIIKWSLFFQNYTSKPPSSQDWEHLNSNGAQLKASQLQPVLTLAEAVMQSVAVWYNVSGSKQCWDIPEVWLVLGGIPDLFASKKCWKCSTLRMA